MPSKVLPCRHLLMVCLLFCSSVLIAQQRTITGKVTDADGQPAVGATITVKGTDVATQTNEEGSFSLVLPPARNTLVITYVGFEPKEVEVGTSNTLEIQLTATAANLSEVVVTGYTTQRRKDITGSVAVVKAEDLKSVPAANAEQQLQGRAAGVTVVTSGVPGAAASVRIRGFGSFTDNNPLYIVDGVPLTNLTDINPNDIESMQVLKDAAAASIYGARASNGVIVITTRRGRAGTARVSYNGYYGRQDPGKGFTNLLNPQEMAELTWLAYRNSNQDVPTSQYGTGSTPRLPDYILAGKAGGLMEGDPAVNPDLYKLDIDDVANAYLIVRANKQGTNWFDVLTENAPIMNHNIAVSGGAGKSRYLFSLDYFDQKAITVFNFFKRYTGRINSEFNVKDNIRIGQNLQLLYREDNTPGNNDEGTPIAMSYRMQPIVPVYDIKGNFAGSRAPNMGNASNPYANQWRGRDNRGQLMDVFGNVYAEVDFLRNFTARSSFGGQINSGNYYFYSFQTYENSENNTGNSYTEGSNRFRSWTWTNQLTFRKNFNERHNLLVLAGTEAVEDWGRFMETGVAGLFTDLVDYRAINSGNVTRGRGAPYTPSALFSLFGRIDYTFNDRYLANFTIRRDGSSRFGPESRYGVFPAGSVGWRISEENFMQDMNWITDLKLRASYGIMGNQRGIRPENQFTTYGSNPGASGYDLAGTNTGVVNGFISTFIGNPAGGWEENVTQNYGFDATLFNGKTEIVFDYYIKKTNDLLYGARQIALQGAPVYLTPAAYNVASMRNNGVDLLITQRAKLGGARGVNLDATLTFTTYNNKITALAPGVDFFEAAFLRNGAYIRNAVGQPVSAFFGYKVIGLFQSDQDVANSPQQDGAAPGRFKYLDATGDNKITAEDRVFFGDPNPDFTYGLNLNAAYQQFDFSAFFYGVQGRDLINYVRYWTDFFPSFQGAKSKDLLYNSWSDKNPGAKTPIAENVSNFSNNAVPNSYYLENGSYLRLRNLTIGYTLPNSVTERVKIDRLRIYVQGTNLFTATKYNGLDPEIIGDQAAFGIDAGAYPMVRQYLLGINLNF